MLREIIASVCSLLKGVTKKHDTAALLLMDNWDYKIINMIDNMSYMAHRGF
jgi:hypothetical protein